ncbi:MAG: hypothetical protein DHS20C14_06710 [Phycisphaeraceae bacterium]|nr:MAG: hypothetical protein DHS20C14_06710 [Phycisphaeraceae bacterium]
MKLLLCFIMLFGACSIGAQPVDPPAPAPVVPARTPLDNLSPDHPERYLIAAEDLLARAEPAADAALVRELLARAILLGHRRGQPTVSASACLVLIDPDHPELLRTDADRLWLSALARSLEPALVRPDWLAPSARWEHARGAVPAAALALARLRNGDPRRARLVLDEPGVLDALRASPELAAVRGPLTVEQFFEEYGDTWPCPTCRGDRFVESTGTNPRTYERCPHCAGDPGPRLSDGDLIMMLRAELALAGGGSSSWARALASTDASPLREPDPEHIASVLSLNLSNLYRRDGAWVDGP